MLLAVDIGNTNVTLGVFKKSKESPKIKERIIKPVRSEPFRLATSWRLSTGHSFTSDEYGTKILDLLHYATIEKSEINAVAVASVVPALTPVFEELSQKIFNLKPLVIGAETKIPILNLYENPKEVGADRIVNAVAAFSKFGGPCIVVDFGTATTFDCITKKGEYIGGLIVPGPILSAESLALHTARLPKVQIAKPDRFIGRNTTESIQSGLYFGYIALVDGIIERLKSELGTGSKIVATGGLASLLSGDSKTIKKELIFPELTLEGIRLIFEQNQK